MKLLLKEIGFLRRFNFWLRFVYNNKYIPNFKVPKTFNEKINYRKRNANHRLFSICSDKIAAKEYVAAKIGWQYIIPNLYIGEDISVEQLQALLCENGDCLLKANHNSGPVYLLSSDMSVRDLKAACDDVNSQLTIDFGKYQNEPWYSDIKPQVLVEKRIYPEEGDRDLKDYKFHVFQQKDGTFKVILEVHFGQSSNHTISYFDEELNWLPLTVEYPNIVTKIQKPKNYELMLEKAKALASEFTYVRVDFYNVAGEIYFGELTFAKTSGKAIFMHRMYDLWMGNFWQGDPAK